MNIETPCLQADPNKDMGQYVRDLATSVRSIKDCFDTLEAALPCKEFELCTMDVVSILDHLNTFLTEGPSAPFIKIPLEQTEMKPGEL